MKLLCALLVLALTLGCSDGPTAPATPPPPPLPNYTGIWTGSYAVTSCTQNGTVALANICGGFTAGSIWNFQLNLIQGAGSRQINAGNFTLGTVPFNIVPTTMADSGAVTVTGTNQSNGITVLVSWTFSRPIAGTIVQVWSASGLTGQVNISGTISTVNKTGSERAAPLTRPRSLPDLLRAVQE